METFLPRFKTKICPDIKSKKQCHNKKCQFYHNKTDHRRDNYKAYKPILCSDAIFNDSCEHEYCKYCRNYIEYAYHPLNYK